MGDIAANTSVTLWLKKSCGSNLTRKGYIEGIKRFFKNVRMELDELVAAWRRAKYRSYKAREKFLEEWTENIEEYIYNNLEDWTVGSRMQHFAVIVSFFKQNRIPYIRKEKSTSTRNSTTMTSNEKKLSESLNTLVKETRLSF